MHGCFYEFCRRAGRLCVFEQPAGCGTEERLELLDSSTATAWGGELPVRLRELYSHWLHRTDCDDDGDVLLLRPLEACSRSVSFVCLPAERLCLRVPSHP